MPAVVLSADIGAALPLGPCGAFGKIAAAGDFIRFGLPGDFVAAWDVWLQSELAAARDGFGRRWHDTYMAAPIWRFTLAGGLAGDAAVLGVLMPSTDRVGRMFPLTLAVPLAASGALAEVHFRAAALFERLETIALVTLEGMPQQALRRRCADPALTGEAAPDPAPLLAARQCPLTAGQSLWSARLADGVRLMRAEGLPRGAGFAALMDARAPLWQGAAPSLGAPA